jgi:hypothetical protein
VVVLLGLEEAGEASRETAAGLEGLGSGVLLRGGSLGGGLGLGLLGSLSGGSDLWLGGRSGDGLSGGGGNGLGGSGAGTD